MLKRRHNLLVYFENTGLEIERSSLWSQFCHLLICDLGMSFNFLLFQFLICKIKMTEVKT